MRFVDSSPVRSGMATSLSLLVSIASQMLWWATPAEAQSFLQQLFGGSSAQQVQTAPRNPSPRGGIQIEPARTRWTIAPTTGRDASRPVAPEGSGSYTTVCVRMCDGFFFPISHRVPRSRFYRDAEVCQSRCGETESRLFYHSSAGASMSDAVDLTGRSYARLPIAFLHRKQLVSGCACKPAPWSEANLLRHDQYALAEGRERPIRIGGIGAVAVVAGNYSGRPSDQSAVGDVRVTEPASNADAVDVTRTDEALVDAKTVDAKIGDATLPDQSVSQVPVTSAKRSATSSRIAASTSAAKAKSSRHESDPVRRPAGKREVPATLRTAAAKATLLAGAPPRKPTRVASASPWPAPAGVGAKMVWPGDAPVRTR